MLYNTWVHPPYKTPYTPLHHLINIFFLGGNPSYESFFLKTAGGGDSANTADATNDEIEEEIHTEEGALDSKTSEERNVEDFTDLPHMDEDEINEMLETAGIKFEFRPHSHVLEILKIEPTAAMSGALSY